MGTKLGTPKRQKPSTCEDLNRRKLCVTPYFGINAVRDYYCSISCFSPSRLDRTLSFRSYNKYLNRVINEIRKERIACLQLSICSNSLSRTPPPKVLAMI